MGSFFIGSETAAIFEDGEFATTGNGSFTSGTSPTGVFLGKGVANSSGGNPGAWYDFGSWGTYEQLGLAAPASAETWRISFDWIYNQTVAWGTPRLRAYGLMNGETRSQGDLLDTLSPLPENTGGWSTGHFLDVSIPAGYDHILLEWHTNTYPDGVGLDNLLIQAL